MSGASYNFSLEDLANNDVSSSTNTNPFLAAYLQGSPTNKAPVSSSAYLSTQGQSYDTYASTSMLSLSDVMMGSPLQNSTTNVLNTQQTLLSSVVQYGLGKSNVSNLNVYQGLLPTDVYSSTVGSSSDSNTSNSSNNPTAGLTTTSAYNSLVTPSRGIPTTSYAPGGLPQGDSSTGLPIGYVQYPKAGASVLIFLNYVASKLGDNYVWGAAGPSNFDCSGLVKFALQQTDSTAFASWPHYSGDQYQTILKAGLNCSLEEAYNTAGALMFVAAGNDPAGDHVAISLGNNNLTIEAMDPALGVRKGTINDNNYDVAGLIPGLDYSMVSYGNGISTMPTSGSTSTALN